MFAGDLGVVDLEEWDEDQYDLEIEPTPFTEQDWEKAKIRIREK
jgi:hypothetical protein